MPDRSHKSSSHRREFDLEGHPQAKKCYAFDFVEDDRPVIKTVLGVPTVDSPENAVRAAIAS